MLAQGRQPAAVGLDDLGAALAQRPQVRPGRRVLVHAIVHRRGDHERAAGGERAAAQQVVRQPGGELGDRVRRRRRDHVHLGVAHQLQMAERLMAGQGLPGERPARGVVLELADEHGRSGQRLKRRRPDKAPARRGLHDPDGVPGPRRQAHELERLVCGDAAAHAEQDSGHDLVVEGVARTSKP